MGNSDGFGAKRGGRGPGHARRRIRRMGLRLIAVLLLTLVWALEAAASSGPRTALVIGNAAYETEEPLANTGNDARDMAAALHGLGFEVEHAENLDKRALARQANDFIRRLRARGGVGLFYYSGHGLQVGGKNYLLPVDVHIRDELDVPFEAYPVDRLLAGMGRREPGAVNLVVLDACRNNPYRGAKGLGAKGLARVDDAPPSTLLLYATKPGQTASDNPGGRNGLFTKHLLTAMRVQDVEVEQAFKQVVRDVYRESGQAQYPWLEGVLVGRFYFRPDPGGSVAGPDPGTVFDGELVFWNSTESCATKPCYRAYLEQYPEGRFVRLARAQLERPDGIKPQKPKLIPFTVKTSPTGAQVRIHNIFQRYHDGIELTEYIGSI